MNGTIDAVTHTYKDHNEDICGTANHCYWVLDGALSLNKSRYTDAYSDVVWMVHWWQAYLEKNLCQRHRTVIDILEEGIRRMNEDFSLFVNPEELSKLDRASAGIGIVRVNGNRVECFNLGDVEVTVHSYDGGYETLVDWRIEAMDGKVTDMIFNNPNRKIVFNGYTQEELDILQEHRMKMNGEDGYAILEHEEGAIRQGSYKEFPLNKVEEFLIMSDGFSAAYNKYNLLSIGEVFEKCRRDGTASVVKMIRDAEEEDMELKKYKRLRQHDDATAIYASNR